MFKKLSEVVFDSDPKAIAEARKGPDAPKKGDPKRIMSRGQLREFARCPGKWLRAPEEEATKAMDFGSLVDCLITSPQLLERQFAIAPQFYPCDPKRNQGLSQKPWNNNSTFCKEWNEEKKEAGLIPIKQETFDEAQEAVKRFFGDERLNDFCTVSQKQAHAVVEWHDPDTGIVVPFSVVADYVPSPNHPKYGSCLGDLKTTADAHRSVWPRHCYNQGYHYQAALYIDVLNVALQRRYSQWCHLIVENEAPFEPARRMLDAEFIGLGRTQYLADLALYCQCLKHNEWPGLDDIGSDIIDGWRITAPEAWMITKDF